MRDSRPIRSQCGGGELWQMAGYTRKLVIIFPCRDSGYWRPSLYYYLISSTNNPPASQGAGLIQYIPGLRHQLNLKLIYLDILLSKVGMGSNLFLSRSIKSCWTSVCGFILLQSLLCLNYNFLVLL